MDRNEKIAITMWITATIAAFSLNYYDSSKTKRKLDSILKDPATTVGRWTSKDCNNHAGRQYTFSVDQVPYHGSGGPGDPDCGSVILGATVKVVYERASPDNNFAGRIEDIPNIIANDEAGILFPLFWSIGAFFLFVRPQLRKPKQ